MMKRGKWLLMGAVAILTGCMRTVPAGNVGIMVDLYGSNKGVQAQQLGVGRYWVGVNQELYLFPTFTQTYAWTQSPNEGKAADESITFNDKDGQVIGTDVGITYHIDPDKAALLFQKYRKPLEDITDVNLRNMVRDGFSERASTMSIEDIYGSHKADLVKSVQDGVQAQVANVGIIIEKVYLINHMRLPPSIDNAINAKANAVQIAQQKQSELLQSEADAKKEVARANGDAQSQLVRAQAEAQAIKLRGDALKDNPGLIQLNAIEKLGRAFAERELGRSAFHQSEERELKHELFISSDEAFRG
jgi:regulator of protease activity HflC (stomatin/prohibitin superfamily)